MKRITMTAAAITTLAALTACTPSLSIQPAEDASEGTTSTTDAPVPDAAAQEAPNADPIAEMSTPPGVLAFGDTAAWDDGLEVTATIIGEGALSEYGASDECGPGDPVTLVELTILNGTEESFNPYDDMWLTEGIYEVAETGRDAVADSVFDDIDGHALDNGMSFPTLRPGREGSEVMGYCTVGGTPDSLIVSGDFNLTYEGEHRDIVDWTVTGSY